METNWYIGTCSKMFKFFKYINSRNFKSSKFYIIDFFVVIDVVIGGDGWGGVGYQKELFLLTFFF